METIEKDPGWAKLGERPAPGEPSSPSTLLDIFAETVARHADGVAIDAVDAVLTYAELSRAADRLAGELRDAGVGPGDRVGIRLQSGSSSLYVGILGVLRAGGAYVPVDADDPAARAEAIWESAEVCGVLQGELCFTRRCPNPAVATGVAGEGADRSPALAARGSVAQDDAWIIFTSGSTGAPKGVAISHRAAAAFVEAEAALWTVFPEDRVLAGLSVSFDASCEEMWLAWANGATLVPAPRELMRTGVEVGPWLAERRVTVISTVPTLAAMWSDEMLAGVRLLILGGEACPPELAWRLAAEREVWNTYGPTEATVVSTATRLLPDVPVTIGWPLDGWLLAVVDEAGEPVPLGETGELIIGGVGLGRYLDPLLDGERYAALPALDWERAYRSGDLVRETVHGFDFIGRRDQQVKLAGRRLELGEIEAQLRGREGCARRRGRDSEHRRRQQDPRRLCGGRCQSRRRSSPSRRAAARWLGAARARPRGDAAVELGQGRPRGVALAARECCESRTRAIAHRHGGLAGRALGRATRSDRRSTGDTDFFACGGSSVVAAKLDLGAARALSLDRGRRRI